MNGTARSKRVKPVARAVPRMFYLGRNDTDHTITMSIRGQHYEYFLTPTQCDTVEYLCKHISVLKALGYAKSRAKRVLKTLATSMS